MLDIITTKNEWQGILNKLENYDFYHTFDYHNISRNEKDTPVLIVYTQNKYLIALPLLIREIPDSDYFDATSVWGYTGPICQNIDDSFDNFNFITELDDYFQLNNIISVFSRLNPFIDYQKNILKNFGVIEELHKVVNIDLTKTIENQRTAYSKTTKRYINKYKNLFAFKTEINDDHINTFLKLYYENMDRVNAKKTYYFDEKYVKGLLTSKDFQSDLIFAIYKETNEIVSGAIMIKSNDVIQYHISGTKNKFLKFTPIRHIIDETRINGTNENFRYFNLGGGLGNEQDELFRFKASFSKDFKSFDIWKVINNKDAYNKLVKENKINFNTEYFPLYRYKEQKDY